MGREDTPKDAADTERLMRYWSTGGEGGAKIQWSVPGDFDRCVALVTTAISDHGRPADPAMVKGLCSNLHVRNTGGRPGHAPGIEQATYDAKHHGK